MSTPAQILANRDNAQHSTGPRTQTGKSQASLNSVSHRLARAKIFLANEAPEDFAEMQNGLAQSFACTTPAELAICAEGALAWWKLRRVAEWETEVIEHALTGPDLPAELARLFGSTHEAALKTLHRYETSAHGVFNRAMTQFRLLQKQRESSKAALDLAKQRAAEEAIQRYVFEPVDRTLRAAGDARSAQNSANPIAKPSPVPAPAKTPFQNRQGAVK